jgi:hypothetical protein
MISSARQNPAGEGPQTLSQDQGCRAGRILIAGTAHPRQAKLDADLETRLHRYF